MKSAAMIKVCREAGLLSDTDVVKLAAFGKGVRETIVNTIKKPWIAGSLMLGAGYKGLDLGASGLRRLIQEVKFEDARREMYEYFPHFAEKKPITIGTGERKRSVSPVDIHFSILKKYAPAMAENPVVAGAYVDRMLGRKELQEIDYGVIRDLVRIQESRYRAQNQGKGSLEKARAGLGALEAASKLMGPDDKTVRHIHEQT